MAFEPKRAQAPAGAAVKNEVAINACLTNAFWRGLPA